MKVFHCDHCRHLVFFESTTCLNCGKPLAYLPPLGVIGSLDESKGEAGIYTSPLPRAAGAKYRLCENYTANNVCNWAIPAESVDSLCLSCRLTRIIPDLTVAGNRERWAKLETAKRRLIYTLHGLNLPLAPKIKDEIGGLTFEFLADPPPGSADQNRVLTGHDNGLITLNVAEADDAEREQRRVAMGEPYRTLLGHFRHEVGHYYWDVLIADSDLLESYRKVFGDERRDYGEALETHYKNGPIPDWQNRFVSSYAGSHPWEDWAESWAHYLHMTDTLETAAACGVTIRPPRKNEPALKEAPDILEDPSLPFNRIMESWYTITYVLNNLNRGLGLLDAYPFVLSAPAVEKLRYIHDVVMSYASPAEQQLPVSVLM